MPLTVQRESKLDAHASPLYHQDSAVEVEEDLDRCQFCGLSCICLLHCCPSDECDSHSAPDADPLTYVALLVAALGYLGRLPDAVGVSCPHCFRMVMLTSQAIRDRMKTELALMLEKAEAHTNEAAGGRCALLAWPAVVWPSGCGCV